MPRPLRSQHVCPARRAPQHAAAFTVIEMLVTLVLIGALLGIAVPALVKAMEDARVQQAVGEISALSAEIEVFRHDNDRYPNSLAEIGRGGVLDPYGNLYYYTNIGDLPPQDGKIAGRKDRFLIPINADFDLYSAGADGMTTLPLTAAESQDDIVRANNGRFIGLVSDY